MEEKTTLIQLQEVKIWSRKMEPFKSFLVQRTAKYTWVSASYSSLLMLIFKQTFKY